MSTKGRAVWPAYRDTGSLAVPCVHCAAEPGRPCVKADGRVSKVPCIDRLASADLSGGVRSRTDTLTTSTTPAVDYSEPRHHGGDT